MDDPWNQENRQNAIVLKANNLATCYIENKGNGKFSIRPLPAAAQMAPVYGMISDDVNNDGTPDLLLAGNDFGIEPLSGRHDAFMGLCLLGDGKGNFKSLQIAESGFYIKGDAKGLANIHTKTGNMIVATQNQDSLLVFDKRLKAAKKPSKNVLLKPDDFCADVFYKNGKKQHVEFYYGSTYLSQSSRLLELNDQISKAVITNFKGDKRNVVR